MSTENELFGRAGRTRSFAPTLAPDAQDRLVNALKLHTGLAPNFGSALRKLAREWIDDQESLELRTILLLVADLLDQGWVVHWRVDRLVFEPPGLTRTDDESIMEVKARLQRSLRIGRDRQLREDSVKQFLTRMERRVVRDNLGATSIADLIDDGSDLAAALEQVRRLPAKKRAAALKKIVDPVVEICEAGLRCPDTGLQLIDVWRYFRHTWSHEYRSIPGRQMMVLVRNAARPKRPVMGIAMLASPVMRLGARDNWIGWLSPAAETRITSGQWSGKRFVAAIRTRIENSIAEIRWDDLASPDEIANPSETVVWRLQQKAYGAAYQRTVALKDAYGSGAKQPKRDGSRARSDADWRALSEDLLFVRKRAENLAELLYAKMVLADAQLKRPSPPAVADLFKLKRGRRAVDIALAEFRKAGLSSRVADVSVCGAVQPYNELLGGKLVALVLTSREVREAYARRYGGHISVIASQMAGRAIIKPADLQILTTTSLYGIGSSQYNRLQLKAADHWGIPADIRWSAVEKSSGYGTIHLGPEALQALRQMAERRHDARRINNRFGEGTSPRLRQIREGLDALGIESDKILHHATPRIFYGCELEPGARDILLAMNKGTKTRAPSVAAIGAAWRRRWVEGRILNPEIDVIDRIAKLGLNSVRSLLHPDEDFADLDQLELFE